MHIRPFCEPDTSSVVALWRACDLLRPWNDPWKDIKRKLAVQRELFLVGELDSDIVASAMAGYDGHRGWINYLAVAPSCRRQGLAGMMVNALATKLAELGCPKLNLQVRAGNTDAVAFYRSLGFTEDATISMGKRLIAD